MANTLTITNLIEAEVYDSSGKPAGAIEELFIDPVTGVICFVTLEANGHRPIRIPWSAIIVNKSIRGFSLTPFGEHIVQNQLTQTENKEQLDIKYH